MACENQLSEFSSLRKHLSSSRISWAGFFRQRQCYSASQLEILNRELENGTARKKNADIATEISGLDGAREVTTQDVKTWFNNIRCRSHGRRRGAGGGEEIYERD